MLISYDAKTGIYLIHVTLFLITTTEAAIDKYMADNNLTYINHKILHEPFISGPREFVDIELEVKL